MKVPKLRAGIIASGVLVVCLASWLLFVPRGDGKAVDALGLGQVTARGITVTVGSVVSTGSETQVTVSIDGHTDLGDAVASFSRPVLVDESHNGRQYQALRAKRLDENGRSYEFVFEALPNAAAVTFRIGDFVFESLEQRVAYVDDLRAGRTPATLPARHSVRGVWQVSGQAELQPGEVRNLAAHAPYGPGRIVVERAVIAPDKASVTVTGHIEGMTPEELSVLQLAPASLAAAGGSVEQFLGGRSGFGPGRASFELRFSFAHADNFVLTVPFGVTRAPVAPVAGLQRYDGENSSRHLRSLERSSTSSQASSFES